MNIISRLNMLMDMDMGLDRGRGRGMGIIKVIQRPRDDKGDERCVEAGR